jgi:hypothetical protein
MSTPARPHNNVDGFGTLAQLGPLPERVRTPTGGMHIYLPSNRPVRSRVIGPGLELRAANQYVIAPPSPGYVVINDVPLARLPDWLFDGPTLPVKEKKRPGAPGMCRHACGYCSSAMYQSRRPPSSTRPSPLT